MKHVRVLSGTNSPVAQHSSSVQASPEHGVESTRAAVVHKVLPLAPTCEAQDSGGEKWR